MWACVGYKRGWKFRYFSPRKCTKCAGLACLLQFLLMLSHAIVIATPYGRSYCLHFMDETDLEGLVNLLKVPELASRRAGI